MSKGIQYLLLPDAPEKEEKFKQGKKHYGTELCFAFHGSAIENWHGIIRRVSEQLRYC